MKQKIITLSLIKMQGLFSNWESGIILIFYQILCILFMH